jgi:hypothetical protein
MTDERRHGGLPMCLLKVAGLGFLLCKEGDLCLSWSGWSGEFRKAPLANITMHDGWSVVDDDNYNQSVGNPKRKV